MSLKLLSHPELLHCTNSSIPHLKELSSELYQSFATSLKHFPLFLTLYYVYYCQARDTCHPSSSPPISTPFVLPHSSSTTITLFFSPSPYPTKLPQPQHSSHPPFKAKANIKHRKLINSSRNSSGPERVPSQRPRRPLPPAPRR